MATATCNATGCKTTSDSGKIFYQCESCRRWFCSSHGSAGKKCICNKGYLRK